VSDDVGLHAARAGKGSLCSCSDTSKWVERRHQTPDSRVEFRVGWIHAGVRGRHLPAGVLAATAGLADRLDRQPVQPGKSGLTNRPLIRLPAATFSTN